MHSDTEVGVLMWISANNCSIRATLGPRRGERTKTIYRRISWYVCVCHAPNLGAVPSQAGILPPQGRYCTGLLSETVGG
eukprot:2532293-Prymnesium_polylepis.1